MSFIPQHVGEGAFDKANGRPSCHIGEAAAEITQAVAIAVKLKATKADFEIALHPTAAEELVTMPMPTARYVREAAAE
jgi:glutathione reductase (NADPH)